MLPGKRERLGQRCSHPTVFVVARHHDARLIREVRLVLLQIGMRGAEAWLTERPVVGEAPVAGHIDQDHIVAGGVMTGDIESLVADVFGEDVVASHIGVGADHERRRRDSREPGSEPGPEPGPQR
jgi:hypothetical protein